MGCCWGRSKDTLQKWEIKQKKSCTDIICLGLFILYVGAMACITAFSISTGGADRVIYGSDSYGNICGQNNTGKGVGTHQYHGLDMTYKPFVFFFDFVAESAELVSSDLPNTYSLEACVHKCPDGHYSQDTATPMDYLVQEYQEGNNLCFKNYDLEQKDFDAKAELRKAPTGKNSVCPALPIKDHTVFMNRCIPKSLGDTAATVAQFFNNIPTVEKIAIDLYSARYTLLYTSLISIALSVISVLLLRFLASVLVWVVIGGLSFASLVATALLWYSYAISEGTMENEIDALDQVVNPLRNRSIL